MMTKMIPPGDHLQDSKPPQRSVDRLLAEAAEVLRHEHEETWPERLARVILELANDKTGTCIHGVAIVSANGTPKIRHLGGDHLTLETAAEVGTEVFASISEEPLRAGTDGQLLGLRLDAEHALIAAIDSAEIAKSTPLLRDAVTAFLPTVLAVERGERLLATSRSLEKHRILERRISETLSRVVNIIDLGQALSDLAAQLYDIEFTGIYFRDPSSLHLRLVGARGLDEDEVREAERTAWERHPGRVIQRGESILIDDTRLDPANRSKSSALRRVEIRSRCYLPVNSAGEVVGTLGLASSKPGAFETSHVGELEFLADLAGLTWSRLLEQKRRETRDKILIAAGDAAERLLASRRWVDVLEHLLESMVKAFGASKAYFIDSKGRDVFCDQTAIFPPEFIREVAGNQRGGLTGNGIDLPPGFERSDARIAQPWVAVPVLAEEQLEGILLVADASEGRVHDEHSIAAVRAFAEPLSAKINRDHFEQRLSNAQRMDTLGQLAGGVAHDINNLLMPVLGLASTLALDEPDPERRKSLLDIQLAAERGRDFVEQVLLLTRRRVATDERTDVPEVIREAVTLLKPTVPQGVKIRIDISDPDAGVVGDRTAILRLIQNLITNAVHAVDQVSGEVIAGLDRSSDGEFTVIEIRDNGSGMPEEIRERLFDPFFTTRRSGAERGLGLTIVHRVATELGGEIEVQSEVGKGSSFQIRLPRFGIDRSMVTTEIPAKEPVTGTGLVLVVDDDQMVRSTTEALVASLGYDVIAADNGRKALSLLESSYVDLVLSDLSMPEMDGIEFIREARNRGFCKAAALITGYGEDAIGSTESSGVDEILRKPISRDELGRAIQRLLDRVASS